MKAAFAIWEDRIAPVFDTARQLRLVESDGTAVTGESLESLVPDDPHRIAGRLTELGVGILVCGAISRPLHQLIVSQGIEVVPFVTGETGTVVRAWLGSTLDGDRFAMPGCCGRRRGQGRGCGQGGECVCPACGHRLPHERGVPCVTRRCPKCGAAMTRA